MTLKERAIKMGLSPDASEESVLDAERAAYVAEGKAAAKRDADAELARRDAITALSKEHTGKISDLDARADAAIADKTITAEAFGREILALYADAAAPTTRSTPAPHTRGSNDSTPSMIDFKLSRFLLGTMDGGLDGLEREVQQEGQREAGDLGLGVGSGYLPTAAIREIGIRSEMHRRGMTRAQVAGTDGAGGYLVGTDNIGMVGALRPRLVMNKLGVIMLTGLRNNVTLPGIASEGAAEDVAETGSLTPASITLDQRTLSPNRVGTQIEFSLQLLRQSSPQIEGVLADIVNSRIAQRYNAKYIAFLIALSGVNSVVTEGAALTRGIMRQFKTLVAADNADDTLPKWLFNSTVEGKLDNVKVDAGSGLYLYTEKENGEGRVLNREAVVSNLMANANIIYGDHTKAWMGDWGGLDFVRDPYTKAASGQIVLTANGFIDFAVEHEEHFAIAKDVDPSA